MDAAEHIATLFELEHDTHPVDGVVGRSATGNDVPQVTIYWYTGGHIVFFREDVSPSVQTRILNDPGLAGSILRSGRTLPRTTYYFERVPNRAPVLPHAVLEQERWTIRVDAVVACQAWTTGENGVAATVRVDTLREFRGRGFARQATAAWVAEVLGDGQIPYYTHAIDNHASRALARSLGAVEFATGIKYY